MRYFNLIFTNHALQRIEERGLTKKLAWETFNHPDESKKAKNGGMQFVKYFEGFKAGLIAKQDMKDEWVVISFWRDPALPGTLDERKRYRWQKYRKSGFWGKIWIMVKQQLGLSMIIL